MYIVKFQINNYKSFLSSQEINLTPGFNVIVGQNNAGKTAFVEALSIHFSDRYHISMKTVPSPGIHLHDSPTSSVQIAFKLAEGETEQLLINARGTFYLPIRERTDLENAAPEFLTLLRQPGLLQFVYEQGGFATAYLESLGEIKDAYRLGEIRVNTSQRQLEGTQNFYNVGQIASNQFYGPYLANILRERIYIFRAERLNVSQSSFGTQTVLSSNASNLAEVLHNLQSINPTRFRRFNQHVSTIFPEIKWVTIPSGPENNQVQILIWSIDPDTERADLAIPLSESGTGIGQVLAMLYVVLTADYPRTIIIDEPQSFLNPGAVRKLIEILKQYTQHQFIITTHSPEVVSVVKPQTLFLLRKVEAETIIEQLDSSETQNQKLLLSEVGARLSDVFGADNILWLEGATEELCFPLIVEKVLQKPLQGTKIIGVVQTGDFESKHSSTVLKIYDRLTTGSGLIPPATGFIFDREGRSQQAQEDLIRRSQNRVVFLPRRMYENYLLNPHAIASVVLQIEGFRESPVTFEEVEHWLQCNHSVKEYYDPNINETHLTGENWIQYVHGAKLLETIFKKFSECRVEYDKVKYGVGLTEWILENSPSDLQEVADIIASRLEATT
jgi:energy-coupling factor transporter ATP-binding protein EcfA2